MHNKILAVSLAAIGFLSAGAVQAADEGSYFVRARALYVNFDNGQNITLAKVEADDRWIPEVDVGYFFTPNIAAELVLTYPQTVDVMVNGAKQGSVKALPPSLMIQYHVTEMGACKRAPHLALICAAFGTKGSWV